MKLVLVLRCEHGHEQRIAHDERYSRDVVRAFGVFYCGGSAMAIAGPSGEAIQWPDGACLVEPCAVCGQEREHLLHAPVDAGAVARGVGGLADVSAHLFTRRESRCGGALCFTIEEAP